jgi:hypothetical protein
MTCFLLKPISTATIHAQRGKPVSMPFTILAIPLAEKSGDIFLKFPVNLKLTGFFVKIYVMPGIAGLLGLA